MRYPALPRNPSVSLPKQLFLLLTLLLLPAGVLAQTGNVVVTTSTAWPTGTYNVTSLTVQNGATLTVGGGSTVTVTGAVTVTANSNVVLQGSNTTAQVNGAWAGAGSTLNAGSVQVDTGSSINADGQGYVPGAGPGAGTFGDTKGGSYGGAGGDQLASTLYGSDTAPVDLGSGGGQYQGTSTPGGGAIRLIVSGMLSLNGTISANAAAVSGIVGGSAGGSVYVTAGTLAGAGTFAATGGSNSTTYGRAGGGGRIAVFYTSAGSYTGFSIASAAGGTAGNGGTQNGGVGTVEFVNTSSSGSNLNLYQNFAIPANTTATYNTIAVQNGAVLTIGGSSSITVNGAITVTGGSSIVLQSVNTAAQVSGVWAGAGSTLTAANVQVDSGSSINADGQGYVPGAGPGAGTFGDTKGGSYGGAGGDQLASTLYGSDTAPVDLGSGGGQYQGTSSPGGGAIRLIVSGTVTVNGTISANAAGVSGFVGGSAGGSIYVTAGTLAGAGTYAANGGANSTTNGRGGGGGRVAVYYASAGTFTGFSTSSATGGVAGNGGTQNGGVGTVEFVNTSSGGGGFLNLYQNFTIPANTSMTYAQITVQNGATLTVGGGSAVTVTGALLVTGNSNILVQSINNTAQVNGVWAGAGSSITAASIQVDAGSTINADGQGYIPMTGPGAGVGGDSKGGSYGGAGGAQLVSTTYGSTTAPVDLGSGGGQYQGTSSPAGGAIRLQVSGTLTNNGVISANAGPVSGFVGGSAGGSIYVTTATLTGAGSFNANGGLNTTTNGRGGGGGRIAIYSANAKSFTGFTTTTATGGTFAGTAGVTDAGSTGTSAFFDTSVTNNNVGIYQNFVIPASTQGQYNSITVQNGGLLIVGGGSTVTVAGLVTVTGKSNIIFQSVNNTAQVNSTWQGAGSTFVAGSVQVDAGSTINADALGYLAATGPGAGLNGNSLGGSYGGAGGGQAVSTTYGSSTAPVDLGSGGGSYQGTAGGGGGAIHLQVSGTLTNNGVISAQGVAANGFVGAGAGGSVYVQTSTLAGAGTFNADGGTNSTNNGSGGGGGRVAVYYAAAPNYTGFSTSTATGGATTGNPGANGTAAFFDTSMANNNVNIYQHYDVPANAITQFNSLNVASGATVTLGGASQLIVAQTLQVNGTMLAQSINNTSLVNGKYQGRGIKIVASTVTVGTTGIITADGQGYPVQFGPGAGVAGNSQGGSYGGAGGNQASTTTYGSATAPIDLGSGGGQYQGTGGAGGGAIQIFVSGTLTNNGTITANGIAVSGFVGGGAGGSIYLGAHTIAGTGPITANGGLNTTSYGSGGGGGRIAIDYVVDGGLTRTGVTAAGGTSPGGAGSAGTVMFVNAPISLFLLPTSSVGHGTITLQWFSDNGTATTVLLNGPKTVSLANGSSAISTATFDTTTVPDGSYQLVLQVLDANGNIVQKISKPLVINNSVIWYSGTLTANAHWTANNVYGLDGIVIIPSGITLTIDPGTVIKALPGAELLVQSGGTLNALGTAGTPVIFTTFDDSSVGGNTDFNQGITIPTPGEWNGVVVLGGATFASNTNTSIRYTQTLLSGTIPASQTLYGTQNYEISGTLNVASGATLTIQPGTIVKFDPGAGLNMQPGSTLLAVGNLAQPIYFTSVNDTSVGSSAGSTSTGPNPGDWNSILIDAATATLKYVQMQYGGGPVGSGSQAGMLETDGNSTVIISNSTFAYSYAIGIQTGYPNGGGDTITLTDSTFYGNQDRAINEFGSTMHIVNDTFDGNAAGVFNHGGLMDVENSVVTNNVSTQFGGIGLCCGGTFTNLANNDVYNTAAGVSNYVALSDPTGQNGNISASPIYMNGPLHDYRPTYGSPLIDAGNGTVPNYPATDAFGIARYNAPLVTTKTGTADSNSKYPDIGAFEFVQSAPSNLDFTVSNVSGPATALVGTQVTLTWTVTNIGTGTAYGPWHDGLYLVTDPNTNPVEVLAGQVLEGQGIVLGPGASYSATGTVTVPGTVVGEHRWEVKTNVRGEVFEGINTGNNTGISVDPVVVDLPQLILGAAPTTGGFTTAGQSAYYKVVPGASQAVSVQLGLTNGATGSVQVFVGAGYVPSPQHYDYQQSTFNSTTAAVTIPNGATQTYYVTAYAQTLTSPPVLYSIQATAVQFALTSVTPNYAVTQGTTTLTFLGGGFTSHTAFSLTNAAGAVFVPTTVFLSDSTKAELTFNLSSAVAGSYSAKAVDGTTATLSNAVTVTSGTSPLGGGGSTVYNYENVQVTLEVPEAFRAGFAALITVNYRNIASFDIPAPLIFVYSNEILQEVPPTCTGCDPNFALKYGATFNSGLFLGINQQGPAGVLPAGASGSMQFFATPTGTGTASFYATPAGVDIVGTKLELYSSICGASPDGNPLHNGCQFTLNNTGSYASAISWCSSLTPQGASSQGFLRACMGLLNNAGFTYTPNTLQGQDVGYFSYNDTYTFGHLSLAGLNAALAADATALSASGVYESDVQRLLGFELNKDGLQQFNTRYHQGAFGFGVSHPFDITLTGGAGSLVVHYPDGSSRGFTIPSPTQAGVYLGTVGDYGTATLQADSTWLITETNGNLYHFLNGANSTGALDSIQDRNGNKISVTYAGTLVSGASDNFGNKLSFTYDGLGHITQATDGAGRTSRFTYDILKDTQNSTFLTSITGANGTTSIVWNEGTAPYGVGAADDSCVASYCGTAISIASIAHPDGTHVYYTYDALGRLLSQSNDGGTQAIAYTYNNDGSITSTDALGKTMTATGSQIGKPLTVVDPLGNVARFRYDAENKPVGLIEPLGDSTFLTYNNSNNVASTTTPAGNLTNFAYTTDQSILSITNPAGNTFTFGQDAALDVASIADPSGAQIKYTYDSTGSPLTRINRRGATTTYTYQANGLLSTKTYSTGKQFTYTYDGHQNLLTATSPLGTTKYGYDAADHLTSVTSFDGTSLQFTYGLGDQRTSMTDSTGFVTNYKYDAVGRLSSLTNSAGTTLASYTYTATGALASKTLGNGTSTSYTYDASGNVLSVINSNAAKAVVSEYDYTYDADSRPITQKNPTGTLTYAYDLDGQLTSVVTPAGTIQYTYDPNGNRTAVSTNGSLSTWFANNLDEYQSANGAAYQYDADGNLLSGNGNTYTYDEDNRLLTMVNATDSWAYSYDAFGRRIATVHNGVITHYLNDPSGNGSLTAEFDGSGNLLAHFVSGLGLVSTVQPSGAASYYNFDGTGNTTQLTNAAGAVVNSYVYLPFGEKTVLSSSVTNPFTFVGQSGIQDEGSGLYLMRDRWYNPTLGRFQQQDQSGLAPDANLYRYVVNSPVAFVDPLGRDAQDVLNTASDVATHGLNAASPFIKGDGATALGGVGNVITGTISLTQDYKNGDVVAGIHDGTLFVLGAIGTLLPEQLAPGPLGVLQGVIKYSGTIDEVSQGVFNGFFNRYYNPPSPLTNPCGNCITLPNGLVKIPVKGAIDPNGKITSGFGDQGFIPAGVPITYTIFFENQPTATLPAQKVVVTDQLPTNLDWSTVQLTQVAFNNQTLNLSSNTQTYNAQANVTTDPNPVSVVASLNPSTGLITWTMQSVDAVTGGAPANPLAGFLPPNTSSNSGFGSVTFTVMPQKGLANTTSISNQGSIRFDLNSPILTNTVTNTIDTAVPTSSINPLPASTSSGTFAVSWTGSDPSGAGISSYNIYVSVDSGAYSLWLSATALTTANYIGAIGHSYTFVSLATNNIGIQQTSVATPQTINVVSGVATPTVTVTPAASAITTTQALSVAVAVTGSATNPTGSVVLTSGTYTSTAIALSGGSATVAIPAGALAAGSDALTVSYTPDTASASTYAVATGTATVTVTAVATTEQVTVGTSPVGAAFSVDGTTYTTTQTLTWTIGSTHTLATTSPQTSGGTQQTFTAWSDSGAMSHSVTAAAATTKYTATLSTAYQLTTAANPAAGGTVTPASGTFYTVGTVVNLLATPATGYTFTSWTGPVANTTGAATTVTVTAAQIVTANFTASPNLTVTPSSAAFVSPVGVTSAAQTVQLTNSGGGPLTITSIALAGTSPAAFAQTSTCGTSLAAGGTCTVAVTFTPATTGSFSASLIITDNDPKSPQTIALTGQAATTFTLSANPASKAVLRGSSAAYTISAMPQGGAFNGVVTLSVTGLPSGATASFAPSTITPGASGATSVLTIQTSATQAQLESTGKPLAALAFAGVFLIAGRRRKWLSRGLLFLAGLSVAISLSGCGSKPPSYTITVTGTSGTTTQTTNVSLTLQ